MVSDKFQARASSGPNDPVTSQPVKGRARGGGVRMGEMERDGIISHGCTMIARDRLFQCSDYATVNLCSACGNLLAPTGQFFCLALVFVNPYRFLIYSVLLMYYMALESNFFRPIIDVYHLSTNNFTLMIG